MADEYIKKSEAIARMKRLASMIGFETPAVAVDCMVKVIENMPPEDVVSGERLAAAIFDLQRYNDCAVCAQPCGGSNFELATCGTRCADWKWRLS